MYSTKMSLKSFLLIASIVLYSTNQVSGLQCYICASISSNDCYKNPKQTQLQDCRQMTGIPEFESSQFYRIGMDIKSVFLNITGNNAYNSILDYECLTMLGELGNEKAVVRTCSVKAMTCDDWQRNPRMSMRIQSCDHCDSDACNSSHHISVGFLSLFGSLLSIFFLRM